uniref:Uncharacterized protein n=1 Tax=Pararge aegeria TaxID=116150 RepID=S4P9C7_9NEOP
MGAHLSWSWRPSTANNILSWARQIIILLQYNYFDRLIALPALTKGCYFVFYSLRTTWVLIDVNLQLDPMPPSANRAF